MEIRRQSELVSRSLSEFGSEGGTVTFIAGGPARVVAFELEDRGRVGLHPTVDDQVLIVVRGTARVSGADGVAVDVRAGDVVRWKPGEEHETVATSAFVAVVVEGAGLRLG